MAVSHLPLGTKRTGGGGGACLKEENPINTGENSVPRGLQIPRQNTKSESVSSVLPQQLQVRDLLVPPAQAALELSQLHPR